MKDIHFIIGYPRTGSTTLTALLDQNPNFYATGSSPLPNIVENMITSMGPQSDFTSVNHKLLTKQFYAMLKGCVDSWHTAETDKEVVFSKSRPWLLFYDELKVAYPNAKFIFCIRDLRGIIQSFEKLIPQFPFLRFPVKEMNDMPVNRLSPRQRTKYWLYHDMSALGIIQKHIEKFYADYEKNPNDFFIFRYEDFGPNPEKVMKDLYKFLGYDWYPHEFNNIQFTPKEYDTAYWSYVDHTVGEAVKYKEPDYSVFGELNEEIINENLKFYEFFYPEVLGSSAKRNRF